MSDTAERPPARHTLPIGDLSIGIGVLALSGIAAWQATQIPPSLYAQVGPAFFAWVTVGLVALMGALLTVSALRGGWSSGEDFGAVDLAGGLWVVFGLVLNVATIETLGFILASTLMFAAVARGFGSRKLPRDVAIGFTLALVAYVGFDRVLGYKIGSGLIERLI